VAVEDEMVAIVGGNLALIKYRLDGDTLAISLRLPAATIRYINDFERGFEKAVVSIEGRVMELSDEGINTLLDLVRDVLARARAIEALTA